MSEIRLTLIDFGYFLETVGVNFVWKKSQTPFNHSP